MKFKIIYYILIFFSFSCERNARYNQHNNSSSCEKIAFYKQCNIFTDDRKQYDSICHCIKVRNLTFPTENVVSGEIQKNSSKDFGEFIKGESYSIDRTFIDDFKKLTGDTSNFSWGELGTIYIDYQIKFKDKNGNIINTADVSLDGMIATNPKLTTTKWGLLSKKGDSTSRSILLKYIH